MDTECLAPGTEVVFKNLLDEDEDICHGVVLQDGTIECLCGCNGCFEADDVEVLRVVENQTQTTKSAECSTGC